MDAGVAARPQGAIFAELEAVVHFGQTDEEDAEQSQAIPLVVGQYVKVVEHVLMEEVGLVEKEDGVKALLAELLDMANPTVRPLGFSPSSPRALKA